MLGSWSKHVLVIQLINSLAKAKQGLGIANSQAHVTWHRIDIDHVPVTVLEKYGSVVVAVTVPDAPATAVQPVGTSTPAVFAGHATAVGNKGVGAAE